MVPFNRLSKREWEVVGLLLQGNSNKQIAASLGISTRTVEFHLKNIYLKFEVRSRIELILKLGNATGQAGGGELWQSTVVGRKKRPENGDARGSRRVRGKSYREIASIAGRELDMKNLLMSRQAVTGAATAMLTGFVLLALFMRVGHMSLDAVLRGFFRWRCY